MKRSNYLVFSAAENVNILYAHFYSRNVVIPTFSDIFRKSVCYAQNGCAAGDTAALTQEES